MPATLNTKELAALRSLLERAGGDSAKPKKSRKKDIPVQYLAEEELQALFSVIVDPRDRAIFELAYGRGLRASEVGLLTMASLRLAAKRIHVERLKGGNSGEYPLFEDELRALRGWLRIRGDRPGPLFPSRNHRPIGRRRLDELMKHYGAAAGIPETKRHFHCLRHSCGTVRLEDADIGLVQDHLGHRNVQNTMIYRRVRDKRRDELAERIGRRRR